jgi:hypothetical protein
MKNFEDTELNELNLDVPDWIEQDVDVSTVRAIVQGGCSSGAYMPAVTYYQARQTMNEHGDDVLQYIEDTLGEVPAPKQGESWSGIAVHYLSLAVELWASSVEGEIDSKENEIEVSK